MRTHFERTRPATTWGTSVALCLLAALGGLAIARSVPVSQAAVPGAIARSGDSDARIVSNAAMLLPGAGPSTDGRKRTRCPECGTIETMRRIELAGMRGPQHHDPRRFPDADSGGATVANAAADHGVTVRLRDGTTEVFNEATPRAWRPGGRVMVIGGLQVASR
jgi:hypothetical protein